MERQLTEADGAKSKCGTLNEVLAADGAKLECWTLNEVVAGGIGIKINALNDEREEALASAGGGER